METQENVALARSTVHKDQAVEYTNLCNSGKRPHGADWPITADYQHALDRFESSLAAKSAYTKRLYVHGARHFLAFLTAAFAGRDFESITREQAEEWVAFLVKRSGYGNASITSFVQAARQLCKKLLADDVLQENPFAYVKDLPKPQLPDTPILTVEDFQAMLDVAKRERTVWGRRDRALMGLLWYGGLRREELLNIEAGDIDFSRDAVHIRRGKGGAPRTVGVDYRAMGLLDQYLQARRKYLRGLKTYRRKQLEAGPIWLSRKGSVLGANGLTQALRARAEAAGITAPVNPHSWRHAAATHDAEADMQDMSLRDKYGWSPTSAMPFRYTRQTLRERTIAKSRSIRGDDGVKL